MPGARHPGISSWLVRIAYGLAQASEIDRVELGLKLGLLGFERAQILKFPTRSFPMANAE
jgi:hypothetical protein